MKKNKEKFKHDEKTCFRCRLHALVEELYPKGIPEKDNEDRFIIVSLAEAAGQLMANQENCDIYMFMFALMKFYREALDDGTCETRH
jgi:hypothetical protein